MKEETKDKVISAYMAALAKKANDKIAASPEALERARLRAAKAREALKRRREERQERKTAMEAAGKD